MLFVLRNAEIKQLNYITRAETSPEKTVILILKNTFFFFLMKLTLLSVHQGFYYWLYILK